MLQRLERSVEGELRRYFARQARYVEAKLFGRSGAKALRKALELRVETKAGSFWEPDEAMAVATVGVAKVTCTPVDDILAAPQRAYFAITINGEYEEVYGDLQDALGQVDNYPSIPKPGTSEATLAAHRAQARTAISVAWARAAQSVADEEDAWENWTPQAASTAAAQAQLTAQQGQSVGQYLAEEVLEELVIPNPSKVPKLTQAQEAAIQQSFGQLDFGKWNDELAVLSKDLVQSVFGEAGAKIKDVFGLSFDVQQPGIQAAIQAQVNRIVGCNATTFGAIQNQLLAGIQAGEGIPKLSKRVRGVFDQADRYRSRVIARTETLSAVNTAQYLAAKDSGVVKAKRWLSASDERTRISHAQANGQTVALEEQFSVGGYPMDHPGDRDAPAREVIQCRCTVIYETVDEVIYPDGSTQPKAPSSAQAATPGSQPGYAEQAAIPDQWEIAELHESLTNAGKLPPSALIIADLPLQAIAQVHPVAFHALATGKVNADTLWHMTEVGDLPVPSTIGMVDSWADADEALDWIVGHGAISGNLAGTQLGAMTALYRNGKISVQELAKMLSVPGTFIPTGPALDLVISGKNTYAQLADIAGDVVHLDVDIADLDADDLDFVLSGDADEVSAIANADKVSDPLKEGPPPAVEYRQDKWWTDDADYSVRDLTEVVPSAQLAPVNLGGAHSKSVYRDKDGVEWLFKPQPEFRARVDVATARVQHLAGFEAPATYMVTVDGKVGSLQRMFGTEATRRQKFRGGAVDVTKLQAADLELLEEHSAFDWLIGNHDGHEAQFLRLSDQAGGKAVGQVISIDKGQAFKFFGEDALNGVYNPNGGFIGDTVYNKIHKAAKAGQVDLEHVLDPDGDGVLRTRIRQMQAIPDDQYRAILRPYADEALKARPKPPWAKRYKSADDFLDAAVARKNGLLDDVAKLHDSVIGKPKAPTPKPPMPKELKGMTGKGLVDPKGPTAGVSWANAHMQSGSALKGAQREAVKAYTGSHYTSINGALRQGTSHQHVTPMDKAMKPLEGEDVKLWRGVNSRWLQSIFGTSTYDAKQLRRLAQGKVITDPAYSSTSIGSKVWSGEVTLHIRANEGTKHVWAKPISLHSSENEVILARGTRFYVHDVKQNGHGVDLYLETMPWLGTE